MIPLSIPIEVDGQQEPHVIRLNTDFGRRESPQDTYLIDVDGTRTVFRDVSGHTIVFEGLDPFSSDGDVLLIVPEQKIGNRVVRARATDNTLTFTERCDQRCIMCSQPPSIGHRDETAMLRQIALLAPPNAILGISGGEPTLYKKSLFNFLNYVLEVRNDITFHILSNGQHFCKSDVDVLRKLPSSNVTWGIPIYAAENKLHDEIVRKSGSFKNLCSSLEILCRSGASIELRTVVMAQNIDYFDNLSQFITTNTPFVARWAIMQLEKAGFAASSWSELFVDTSNRFSEIGNAADMTQARGLSVLLYNFPLCTVPPGYRSLAPATISDWKQRFLPVCSHCTVSSVCCGFFEWYPDTEGFRGVQAL